MNTARQYRSLSPLRFILPLVAAALVSSLAPALADDPVKDNPHHQVFEDLSIEYVEIRPKAKVENIGDGPRQPEAEEAEIIVYLRNCAPGDVYAAIVWPDEVMEEVGFIGPGKTQAVTLTIPVKDIPYGGKIEALLYDMETHELLDTDSINLLDDKAHRVALLVEKKTFEAGNKQFGSFTRRMRHSFDALHTLFTKETTDSHEGLMRTAIRDQFRIDHVEVFDRAAESDERPAFFENHPEYDVVIMCEEGGPVGGFWLHAYSIGHNFHFEKEGEDRGLWSQWGEQAMWHELLHYRGVPDYYAYKIPAGALPGRTAEEIDLAPPFKGDLMNHPYQDITIGPLAAAVVNSKYGVSRIGAAENPTNKYGHMWRWLPKTLKITINATEGKPLAGAEVNWLAGQPAGMDDDRLQGVTTDRAPDGTATSSGSGSVSITGDYLNATKERAERSLWLLVEVTHPDSGEKRFGIVSGLWLNTVWAAGQKDAATWTALWDDLTLVGDK